MSQIRSVRLEVPGARHFDHLLGEVIVLPSGRHLLSEPHEGRRWIRQARRIRNFSMHKLAALQKLFVSMYTHDELRRMLLFNTPQDVVNALPVNVPLTELATRAAEVLVNRGLVTHALFDAIRQERSGRRPEIDGVEALWCSTPPSCLVPTSRRFHWLDDALLDEVYRAAIDAGLATCIAMLTGGISNDYVGTLVSPGPSNALLLLLLQKMNGVRNLGDGTVPLGRLLKNAALLTRGQVHESVFARALERVEKGDTAEPAPSFTATPDAELAELRLEVVLGQTDQTLSALFLLQGATAARSVARVLVHRHFGGVPSTLAGGVADYSRGTGWLIAPGLLITNHHVIAARGAGEPAASMEDFALQAANTEIEFDVVSETQAPETYKGLHLEVADTTLDFALLRLPGEPARPALRLRHVALRRSPQTPLKERVNLLQHPNGEPMRIGFRNNFVVHGDEKWLSYLTDTQGGSSGSPVCDDGWSVVALHRGFRDLTGGVVKLEGVQVRRENYGVQLTAILGWLQAHHSSLHREIEAGQRVHRVA